MRPPPLSRSFLWMYFRHSRATYLRLPRPEPRGQVTADGPHPRRILLVGTDAASGLGVRSIEVALPGHLARRVRALTGRGVRVDLVERTAARMKDLIALSDRVDATGYDAVVVVGGVTDAWGLRDVGRWRSSVTTLLRTIRRDVDVALYLVAIPTPSDLPAVRVRRGGLVDRWTVALNEVSADVCRSTSGAVFVCCPPENRPGIAPDGRLRSAQSYVSLADHVAAAMVGMEGPGDARRHESPSP